MLSTPPILLCSIILCWCTASSNADSDGMLEKIRSGLRYAKNYLDTAKEIADLVSMSLEGHKNQVLGDEGSKKDKLTERLNSGNLASAFFRLLGLESPRIAAIAVNSSIFLVQMIISLFKIQPKLQNENPESRTTNHEKFNPFEFLMKSRNEKVQHLLKQARNSQLPDQLIDQLDGFDSSCVRLLMCKISPVISAAQISLKNKTNYRRFDLTSWLPTKQTFEENGDICEEKHTDCELFPESQDE